MPQAAGDNYWIVSLEFPNKLFTDCETGEHSRTIWVNGLGLYTKQDAGKVYCLTIKELHNGKQYQNTIKEQLIGACGKNMWLSAVFQTSKTK